MFISLVEGARRAGMSRQALARHIDRMIKDNLIVEGRHYERRGASTLRPYFIEEVWLEGWIAGRMRDGQERDSLDKEANG